LAQALAALGWTGLGAPDLNASAVAATRVRSVARRLVLDQLGRAEALERDGYADGSDIDTAMRFGCGLPAGPLELLRALGGHPDHVRRGEAGRSMPAAAAVLPISEPQYTTRRWLPHNGVWTAGPIGVVGSGTMATGIAEVVATAGLDVILVARSHASADAAMRRLSESLDRRAHVRPADAEKVLAARRRVTAGADLRMLTDCGIVIEAVIEDAGVKRALFAELDSVCAPGAILASTTSSLSITDLAAATDRPSDVLGLHFFNPAPRMKLVEVIGAPLTAEPVLRWAENLCDRLGRTGVRCTDRPGFIVNYLLLPYLNEAVRAAYSERLDPAELDRAIESGFGYPMGPFRLLDTIGLDIALAIQQRLYEHFGSSWLAPADPLRTLVKEGRLGRKSGAGFHRYDATRTVEGLPRTA
jgi:3-hydroxybutyryl-CoA dehydrogenase